MRAVQSTRQVQPARRGGMDRLLAPSVIVFLVAVIGSLQTIGTWWLHDDWSFLGQAAGVAPRDASYVRFVSYDWYWAAMYRLFGLHQVWWGVSRLLLHAGCAVVVTRILGRLGAARPARTAGGLLFAVSPLAFEPTYWGTGAVELLGAFFALAAVERWMAGGRRGVAAAVVLGALAIFSKESGLLLPAFFGLLLAGRRSRDRWAWAAVAILACLSIVEVKLLSLDVSAESTYALRPASIIPNYARFGWWLIAPAPYVDAGSAMNGWRWAAGAVVWLAWGATAFHFWRRACPVFALCLVAALFSLAPASPLGLHLVPRYAYATAAPAAICAAMLLFPAGSSLRTPLLVVLAMGMTISAWSGTRYHLDARWQRGRPIHSLVLKEEISKVGCGVLASMRLGPQDHVVILRDPSADAGLHKILYDALGGEVGPRVLLGKGIGVTWTDRLDPSPAGSFVIKEDGLNLRPQGRQ